MSALFFFFSSRRRHTRLQGDWSSDVCSSDLRSASTTPNQASACSGGIRRLGFRCAGAAQSISRRATRPDMQNWNIAVTVFNRTPLLDTIRTPDDLRRLKVDQIRQVADELRQETIDAVSVTGGHFGAGLGVVELTTALHYIFDTPRDRLVWDVGHQAYPHKILTGRRDRIRTLRTGGGLSGFTKRTESDYDPFGAAHSSTSISAAVGMAYEAMNNAGAMNSRLIVILNDNDMSIAPPVGAMSAYLSRLYSGKTYRSLREAGKQL